MRLFLVRHGMSNYNVLGLCNDDPSDDVHLTEAGIKQAEQAGDTLRNVHLEQIFSSPLPRALQTAAIINRHHNLPIIIQPGLHDIRSGFNGKPVEDYFAAIIHAPLTTRPAGGESLLDYKSRVLQCLRYILSMPFGSTLAVAHEETLRIVYAWFHQIEDEKLRDFHFANGAILEFSVTS
ncbi:MAG: hypothetical protein HW380_28 [Magnetococcales bacterium]|nr:hypothetical protein [Magnetococcales bacterium]HIJ82834.1 histidine phosphatase family protein [Magnetococcales bacterium]